MTPQNPPNSKKEPESAHVLLEFMSFGVIALKHCAGLAPSGMMKPSCQSSESQPWESILIMSAHLHHDNRNC